MKNKIKAVLRLLLCSLVICSLLAPVATCFAEEDGYYIKNFDVKVTANSDRSFDIVETIDAYFNEERHGIVRDISTYSSIEKEIRLENVSVEGAQYDYYDGSNRITIGDPDKKITGDMRYVIKYTLWHYADDQPDFDYLYLNIIGTDWDTKIQNFSASITLPDGANVNKSTLTGGVYGDIDSVAEVSQTGNVISVVGKKSLAAFEGVTINVEMQEGAFGDAKTWRPSLLFHNISTQAVLDNHGIMNVKSVYDLTVNNDDYLSVDLVDYHEAVESKIQNLVITYPDGKTKTSEKESELVDLSEYIGQRIRFELTYDKQFDVRSGKSHLVVPLLMFRGNSEHKIEDVDINIISPFAVSEAYAATSGFYEPGYYDYDDSIKVSVENETNITAKAVSNLGENSIYIMFEMPETYFVHNLTLFDFLVPIAAISAFAFVAYLAMKAINKTKKLVPIPEFYPPKAMNPAELGYIIDESVDQNDLTSLIYYWASKKLLKIEMKDNNDFSFHKTAEIGNGFTDYERHMFNGLWAVGGSTTVTKDQLKETYYKYVDEAAAMLRASHSGGKDLVNKSSNISAISLGCLLPILIAVLAIVSVLFRQFSVGGTIVMMVLMLLFSVAIMVTVSVHLQYKYKSKSTVGTVFRILWLSICAVAIVFWFAVAFGAQDMTMISAILTGMAVAGISLVAPLLKHRTDSGIEFLAKAVGFKQFLMTAEKDRLEMLLEENPDYYFNVLPYAQVLGVSKQWEEKFDGIAMQPPSWADSSYGSLPNYMLFNAITRDIGSSMTSMPQSTGSGYGGGFGGGGFSGGGSGGGGGSSW